MELKEAKRLSKFIEEMRKKNHSVTYNQNDDLLQDLETVLQALDNSIPRKKVREVIDRKIHPIKDNPQYNWVGSEWQESWVVEELEEVKQELLEGENEK